MNDKPVVEYVAIGSIIIDDIVSPEGRSSMGVLGGGASHAVAGMSLWSQKTALASVIGAGFPAPAWAQLQALTDTSPIITRSIPQPRFWQLFETDGTRQELPRTDFELFKQIPFKPSEYPARLALARGVYLQTASSAQALEWVARLRGLNPAVVLLWEPWEILYPQETIAQFCQAAAQFDLVSPQTTELSWLLHETEPARQVEMLLAGGVRGVVLRMGAQGSLLATGQTRAHILPASTTVVDETGAGNAYCGGFLVGYLESGGNLRRAGQYGAVSASFALEQVGVMSVDPARRIEAQTRLRSLPASPLE